MYKTVKLINLIFFAVMIIINVAANTIPLGQGNTGSISNQYPNLFTPAPITFSIWGIIYVLVGYYIVYQFGFFNSPAYADSMVGLIGPWFIISCVMNIAWIFSWHYDNIILSMLFMLGLLFSLIMITVKLSPDAIMREADMNYIAFSVKPAIYAFDIYLGWICAATIANASVLLVKLGWTRLGLSENFWTMLIILVGAVLGILLIITKQRYMSAAAIIWAYCGILIKHISQSGYAAKYPGIITLTILAIIVILGAGLLELVLNEAA